MFTSVMGKEPSYFCLKACGLNFSESFCLNNGPLLATFNNQKVEDFSLIVDLFLHDKTCDIYYLWEQFLIFAQVLQKQGI